ncbi:MAG: hypothetical protein AAFR26_02520 [Cyanobacteria bacterium J06626_4]
MSVYTPTEIQSIVSAPMNVGMAVATVDMGIISTAIEAAAITSQIAGAAEKYPDNSVVQAAFSPESLRKADIQKPQVQPEDVKSGAFVTQAVTQASTVVEMLQGRATEAEIAEYKQFVYDCGNAVANAAGSGLFGTGAKVSEAEAATLEKLKSALGLA